MAPITGRDLYVEFLGVDITGIFRNFDPGLDHDTVEVTAGGDSLRKHALTIEKCEPTLTAIYDPADAALAKLQQGSAGTLTWAPEGTATGKPKWSIDAKVSRANHAIGYDQEVEVDGAFVNIGSVFIDDGRTATWA